MASGHGACIHIRYANCIVACVIIYVHNTRTNICMRKRTGTGTPWAPQNGCAQRRAINCDGVAWPRNIRSCAVRAVSNTLGGVARPLCSEGAPTHNASSCAGYIFTLFEVRFYIGYEFAVHCCMMYTRICISWQYISCMVLLTTPTALQRAAHEIRTLPEWRQPTHGVRC